MNRITRLWSGLRIVTKVNLVVGTVFALAFAYIATTLYFGAASQVRYDSNDFPGAQKAASTFLALSPLERHIGYYNRGTAKAAVGDFDSAQTDLESALDITPPRDECAVRINLAYVYEKQADQVADQDEKKSGELYDQALKTLEDAPQECRPDKSENQEKSDQATERVEEKKDGSQSESESGKGEDSQESGSDEESEGGDSKEESDQPEESDEPSTPENEEENNNSGEQTEEEKKRDELRQRGEDSNREQQQQDPFGNGGRTTPDKPW